MDKKDQFYSFPEAVILPSHPQSSMAWWEKWVCRRKKSFPRQIRTIEAPFGICWESALSTFFFSRHAHFWGHLDKVNHVLSWHGWNWWLHKEQSDQPLKRVVDYFEEQGRVWHEARAKGPSTCICVATVTGSKERTAKPHWFYFQLFLNLLSSVNPKYILVEHFFFYLLVKPMVP